MPERRAADAGRESAAASRRDRAARPLRRDRLRAAAHRAAQELRLPSPTARCDGLHHRHDHGVSRVLMIADAFYRRSRDGRLPRVRIVRACCWCCWRLSWRRCAAYRSACGAVRRRGRNADAAYSRPAARSGAAANLVEVLGFVLDHVLDDLADADAAVLQVLAGARPVPVHQRRQQLHGVRRGSRAARAASRRCRASM